MVYLLCCDVMMIEWNGMQRKHTPLLQKMYILLDERRDGDEEEDEIESIILYSHLVPFYMQCMCTGDGVIAG